MRRSPEHDTTDRLTVSKLPDSTVNEYRNTALTTIQPMGIKPYAAP